jgi:hypothetical protein
MSADILIDRWLSYQEAATHLGISINAVRLRVSRGKLLATRGNDGHPRVLLKLSSSMSNQSIMSSDMVARHDMKDMPDMGSGPVVPLSTLLEVQAQHRADIAEERDRMARQLVERDCLHRDATERLLAQVAIERSLWQSRAASAETALGDLVARIMATIPAPAAPEPAVSWWRRLFPWP